MPNWKKVIISGSAAALSSLTVDGGVSASSFTGSLEGTASLAISASWAPPSSPVQEIYNYVTTTSNYNVQDTDYTIFANPSSTAINVNLPEASNWPGRIIVVKMISDSNDVDINASGTDNIDNNPTFNMAAARGLKSVMLQSDGSSNWRPIAAYQL